MERNQTYDFDAEEVTVLADALAMYASYMNHMVLPMLMGDESDTEQVTSEANTADRLARHFYERHSGEAWAEMSAQFASVNGRPMDMSDLSKFDWFEHRQDDDDTTEFYVDYHEHGERKKRTIEGDRLETVGTNFVIYDEDDEVIWSHTGHSTHTAEEAVGR